MHESRLHLKELRKCQHLLVNQEKGFNEEVCSIESRKSM